LFGGFTGVAWATQHARVVLNPDAPDQNAKIDAALAGYVSKAPWDDDYDLISGLVGFGSLHEQYPETLHNLGVAHGVPGVIAFLGGAVAQGVDVGALLDRSVRWLLAQRLVGESARFAHWLEADVVPEPARSAWCYGDPGVAGALLVGARATVRRPGRTRRWPSDMGLRPVRSSRRASSTRCSATAHQVWRTC
jgi:hypothetical protein